MGEPKFGGVQEVACAARRNRATLLGLCKQPWRNSASSALPACAPAGSSGGIICPSGFADPAAGSGDLEPHLFAAHRAPLMRSVFADPDCPAGSAHQRGRRERVKGLVG